MTTGVQENLMEKKYHTHELKKKQNDKTTGVKQSPKSRKWKRRRRNIRKKYSRC